MPAKQKNAYGKNAMTLGSVDGETKETVNKRIICKLQDYFSGLNQPPVLMTRPSRLTP
jgi:hypothetical protein